MFLLFFSICCTKFYWHWSYIPSESNPPLRKTYDTYPNTEIGLWTFLTLRYHSFLWVPLKFYSVCPQILHSWLISYQLANGDLNSGTLPKILQNKRMHKQHFFDTWVTKHYCMQRHLLSHCFTPHAAEIQAPVIKSPQSTIKRGTEWRQTHIVAAVALFKVRMRFAATGGQLNAFAHWTVK
jgi:hypothetical protein